MSGGRTLSVLVADLVESTRLNLALGPDRADEVRRVVFSRFDEAVAAHDGMLIKTMGDGCLVTFAGAAEAVASGLDLIDTIGRLARQVPGLQLRVGVAVGDVTEENGDVFGDAVFVATRLCAAAEPGVVLATDVVRALAGARGRHEWERVGEMYLKGVDDPVASSAVRPARRDDTHLALARPLRSRPGELFVGRRPQIDVLTRAWKDAASGERRTVIVSGEPGVGKTRLVAYTARRAHSEGALVLFGQCEEDLSVPFQPFLDALRPALETLPRDLVAAHVAQHGGELRRLFPTLSGPQPVDASPDVERARLIEALTDLLVRLSAEQPVVLVLDDLQWAADATVQVLRHLVAADLSAPLLVLATFRDTEVDTKHPVTGVLADVARHDHHAQRLLLEGLDRGEIEELVEAASGDPLTDDDVRFAGALFDRTEGNPFFVSQLLRHLDEARAAFSDDLPAAVRDVVARRLARLGDATNTMLEAAAVCGESFSHALIARVAGMPNVDAAIAQAVGARLLVDDGHGGYRFTHAIVRDALLTLQTAVGRARYHAAAAATLVTLHGDGPSAPLHDLAHHAAAAAILGNTRDAARYAIKAADACMRRSDLPAALDALTRAWRAIDQFDPVDHEARFDVCNRLAELHYAAFDGVVDALETAAASARALDSAERLVELATHAYRWDVNTDDPFAMQLVDDALAMLGPAPTATRALALANGAYLSNFLSHGNPKPFADESLAVLGQLDDQSSPDAVLATEHVALSLMGHGGAKRALALAESVRDRLFSTPVPPIGPIFLSGEAAAYVGMGDREGWDSVGRALDAYRTRTGDPMATFYGRSREVIEALFDGRFAQAPEVFARAMGGVGVAVANIPQVMAVWSMWLAYEEGKSADIIDGLRVVAEMTQGTPGIAAALAAHLAETGNVDEARDVVAKLVADLPTAGRNATFGSFVALMAMATAVTRDASVAKVILGELEPWAGEIVIVPSVVAVGSADRFRGCMLSLLGRHDDAVAALESAIALEDRLDVPPFKARSRYWLARALLARGAYADEARARAELQACSEIAERLGMAAVARAAAALLSSR